MLLYIFSITSIKILLSFWELYKLTVNYVGKKKRKIQKELQKLGAGRGGKGECSPRSPSRKVRTWSSLATEVLSKAKKSQSFASFSPPTAPPNLGFFPSYCKCADCPPSAFRSHSLHFSTAPGANLYDITGSLLPGFLLLLALPREQREEESEVRVFIPLAPSLQGQLRLAVSPGLKGRALLLARGGLYRICPALGSDTPPVPSRGGEWQLSCCQLQVTVLSSTHFPVNRVSLNYPGVSAIRFPLRPWYNESHLFLHSLPQSSLTRGLVEAPYAMEKRGSVGRTSEPLSGSSLFEFGAFPLSAAPADWSGQGVVGSTKEESPRPCSRAVWGLLGMEGTPSTTKVGVGFDSTLSCHLIHPVLLWKQNYLRRWSKNNFPK